MIRGKIFSLILILLLLLSVTVPPACAGRPYEWKETELGAAPVVVFAIPEVTKLTIDGATIILGSAFVMKIDRARPRNPLGRFCEDNGNSWEDRKGYGGEDEDRGSSREYGDSSGAVMES